MVATVMVNFIGSSNEHSEWCPIHPYTTLGSSPIVPEILVPCCLFYLLLRLLPLVCASILNWTTQEDWKKERKKEKERTTHFSLFGITL